MYTGIVVTLALTVVLAACAREPDRRDPAADASTGRAEATRDGEGEEGSPAGAGVRAVTVVATDYTFEVPGDIPEGLATLRMENHGQAMHHIQLYRLANGRSLSDFREALQALSTGGEFPDWATAAGGPGGAMPGGESNATMVLEPGPYALACWVPDSTGVPHVMRGMLQAAQVTAAPEGGSTAEPRADLTLSLVNYGFQFSSPPAAGTRTIRVENHGPEAHEVQIWRLAEGKSLADLLEFIQNNGRGEPPGGWVGGVSELAPGDHAYADIPFKEGDYALICFVPDEKDGKPHFLHGMVQQMRVG